MSKANIVESVVHKYFEAWRVWRISQGWVLGPDAPSSKMSPYLVDDWSQLDEEGETWFRQHVALMLWAQEQVNPQPRLVMSDLAAKVTAMRLND